MTHDKPYSQMILLCLSFYRHNSPLRTDNSRPSHLEMKLEEFLRAALLGIAKLHEPLFSGWHADKDHPGYLVRISPPMVVRAPFHLVPLFPDEAILEDLWGVSTRIKTHANSVICVSGSNAIKKALTYVNDIDLCEYVFARKRNLVGMLQGKTAGDEKLMCLNIKMNGLQWQQPFVEDSKIKSIFAQISPEDENSSSCKIDYLAKPKLSRVMETSNVIIFCNGVGFSASLNKTFAAQEVALGASSWIPNQLCDVWEMGRYVDWLFSEAESYLKKDNAVKALKRLLSLTRVCFLPSYSEKIVDLFKASHVLLDGEIKQIKTMLQVIETIKQKEGGDEASQKSAVFKKNLEAALHLRMAEQKLGAQEESNMPFEQFVERARALGSEVSSEIKTQMMEK